MILGGIGVIPVAFVATLIANEWSLSLQIFVASIVVFGLRGIGIYLVGNVSEEKNAEGEESVNSFLEEFENNNNMNRIVQEYGKFLEDQLLITDASLLPYPKNEINQARLDKEQELCDIANDLVKSDKKD